MIPKIPMQDKRLTPESKGLYAYFRSFAGKGTTAFPGRDRIIDDMQMSKHRYYKRLLHDNLDYAHLVQYNPYDCEFMDYIVVLMLDAILTEEPKQVNIGKETKSREVVKSVYTKLNSSDHIELVMYKFKEMILSS